MSYFDEATRTISRLGAYGDDDRSKRIEIAASLLCNWVFEHLMETEGGGEYGGMGRFTPEHLSRIEQMVALGMMAQFEHDQKMEAELVAGLMQTR